VVGLVSYGGGGALLDSMRVLEISACVRD